MKSFFEYAVCPGQEMLVEAPVSPPETSFHPWGRLANELKMKILGECLCSPDIIDAKKHKWNMERCLGSILGTGNQELTDLAEHVYYEENTFRLRIGGFYRDTHRFLHKPLPDPEIRFLMPQARCAGLIRSLQLVVEGCTLGQSLEDMLLCKSSGWRWLLQADRALEASDLTLGIRTSHIDRDGSAVRHGYPNWFLRFGNLVQLELTIWVVDTTISKRDRISRLPQNRRELVKSLVAETYMLLKSKRARVTMYPAAVDSPLFAVAADRALAAQLASIITKGTG